VLRAKGMSVDQIGLTFALYLPFAFAFLWAAWIDRFPFRVVGPRTGWIALAQIVAVALLTIVAFAEVWPLWILFGLGLVVTTSAATMDLALEAVAVRRLKDRARGWGASAKMAGVALGAIVGGGVLVGLFDRLGWTGAFLALAALQMLALVWLLTSGLPNRDLAGASASRPSLLLSLRRPGQALRLGRLVMVIGSMAMLFMLNRVTLIDLGASTAEVGWIVGTAAPAAGFATALLSGLLIRRRSEVIAQAVFVALSIAAGVAMLAAVLYSSRPLGMVAAIVGYGGFAGLFVVACSRLLAWADSDQPATDYAALYSLATLATLVIAGLCSLLPERIGWSAYYSLALGVFGLCQLAFLRAVVREAA
jgi:predicted MFS family arabinose efflux permease